MMYSMYTIHGYIQSACNILYTLEEKKKEKTMKKKKIMKENKKKSHAIYKTLSLRDFHMKQTSSEMQRFFVLNYLSRGQRKLDLVNTII